MTRAIILGLTLTACTFDGGGVAPDWSDLDAADRVDGSGFDGEADGTPATVDAHPLIPEGCTPMRLRLRLDFPDPQYLTPYHNCVTAALAPFDVVYVDGGSFDIRVTVDGSCSTCDVVPNECDCFDGPTTCGDREAGITIRVPRMGWSAIEGPHYSAACSITLKSIGHLLGLDASGVCNDAMAKSSGCGPKQFRDADYFCEASDGLRDCACTGSTQNGYRHMMCAVGPAL